MELLLVKYQEDFGYGCLDGLFTCTQAELESLKGRFVYFGEVLGKHSDVYTEHSHENCQILPTKEGDIATVVRLFGVGNISGLNPLEYVEEDEDWDELGEEGK